MLTSPARPHATILLPPAPATVAGGDLRGPTGADRGRQGEPSRGRRIPIVVPVHRSPPATAPQPAVPPAARPAHATHRPQHTPSGVLPAVRVPSGCQPRFDRIRACPPPDRCHNCWRRVAWLQHAPARGRDSAYPPKARRPVREPFGRPRLSPQTSRAAVGSAGLGRHREHGLGGVAPDAAAAAQPASGTPGRHPRRRKRPASGVFRDSPPGGCYSEMK